MTTEAKIFHAETPFEASKGKLLPFGEGRCVCHLDHLKIALCLQMLVFLFHCITFERLGCLLMSVLKLYQDKGGGGNSLQRLHLAVIGGGWGIFCIVHWIF